MALGATVYGIDERANATEGGFEREKAAGGVLAFPLSHSYNDEPRHWWYPVPTVLGAWRDLVAAAPDVVGAMHRVADAAAETYAYDLANVGREVLDRAADILYARMINATTATGVRATGEALLELHDDVDALLCTSSSFLLSGWLAQARACATGNDDGDSLAAFYDRMARAQVTTWLPACESKAEFAGGVCSVYNSTAAAPPLMDYANKAWAGLVGNYYGGRVHCYVEHAAADFGAGAPLNLTAYYACVSNLSKAFQYDMAQSAYPMCTAPTGDGVVLSQRLITKYAPLFE